MFSFNESMKNLISHEASFQVPEPVGVEVLPLRILSTVPTRRGRRRRRTPMRGSSERSTSGRRRRRRPSLSRRGGGRRGRTP